MTVSLPVVRTEFGFQRTSCDCEACSLFCRFVPGYLIPADLERMKPPGEELLAWAKEHLRAAPGVLVVNPQLGLATRIPSLVPAKAANGHCHWLLPNGHCAVHGHSPYGCAFVDSHMSQAEAERRNQAGQKARSDDLDGNGPYAQVWNALREAGLTAVGDTAGAKAESLRIKRDLAKRQERKEKKERRKKRKGR